MAPPDFRVQRIEEFQIDRTTREGIRALLQVCFPGYPSERIYFKQLPSFRYLIWRGERLVAHMAVEHRVLNHGGQRAAIFGIVDLCVHPEFRQRKLATHLIVELETLGKVHDIGFLVLLTRESAFYEAQGFEVVHNACQWVVIQAHQTFGVAHRTLDGGLMVKALGDQTWSAGVVDFLGHMF